MNQTEEMITCCFLGHRKIIETEELKQQLYTIIENFILNEKVGTFLFGSKSQFNNLCYEHVTKLKEKYPHIKRIYVRAEFPQINEDYKSYLLKSYKDTYYPEKVINAGKAVYLQRNCEMIDKSEFCVIYYNEDCLPSNRKSGTKLALDYAVKKNKKIVVVP